MADTVVVCIPTTPERRHRLRACIDSLRQFAGHPHMVLTYENNYIGAIAATHDMLAKLADDALVWWMGDDVRLIQEGTLRDLVDAYTRAFPDKDGVVNPDDGIQHGAIITMPLCSVKTLREGTSREFFHNFADNLFTDRMRAQGKYVYVPEVAVSHEHWCNGKAEWDDTYKVAHSKFQRDAATYERLRHTAQKK